jgi:NitT/TauT family transport system substrate-binding protein
LSIRFKSDPGAALRQAALTALSTIASSADASRIGAAKPPHTSVAELGQRGGIFKKHGIALEILDTQGGGEARRQ